MFRKMLFAVFGAAAIFAVVVAIEHAAAQRHKPGNGKPSHNPNAASPGGKTPAGDPCIGCDFPSI